jgi:hypothetical protein
VHGRLDWHADRPLEAQDESEPERLFGRHRESMPSQRSFCKVI